MPDLDLDILTEFRKLTPEQQQSAAMGAYSEMVRSLPVSREGFSYYYYLLTMRHMPYIVGQIVDQLVEAYFTHTGRMIEAWRGFGKSTILPMWGTYVMGKNPVGSTCIVRINEGAAKETAKAMESIIEENPGWKLCFPNVVPDKNKGWSVTDGYYIWDTTYAHDVWMQKCLADHVAEPSLVCGGVTSGIIIGKHPTNGMYFDDLHDENNTDSEREMLHVVKVVKENIIPTWFSVAGSPTVVVMCTPWAENDAYSAMLATGFFKLVKIPIFIPDENGELFEPMNIKVTPAWPEAFPMKRIRQFYNAHPVGFGRMYLVDLELAKGKVLQGNWLRPFDTTKINMDWPMYMGVDFASTEDKIKNDQHDYFALSVGAVIPTGGMVIFDGFRGHLSLAQGIAKVRQFYSMYPNVISIGVEKWGKGETFKDILMYESGLPIVPVPYKGLAVKSKGARYQDDLAPNFMSSRMWLADIWRTHEFLNEFHDQWVSWDGHRTTTGHDDCLDAVYWTAYVGIFHLMQSTETSAPFQNTQAAREPSPFALIAKARNYED